MSTITTILEPDADGTLHLPLPEELRHGKIRITATMLRATEEPLRPAPSAQQLAAFSANIGYLA